MEPAPKSSPGTPSSCLSVAGDGDDWFSVEQTRLLLAVDAASRRCSDCLLSLRDVADETERLRRENAELRVEFERLVGEVEGKENRPPMAPPGFERKRVPKSISIRSSGFVPVRNLNMRKDPNGDPNMSGDAKKQTVRLLVPGASQEETGAEGLEVDAYNQGMAKTELCNKWEQVGWCPYGEQCQFAHGVHELRPVIRHPRYKTQLCRMVGAPGGCPYGHRCHFRHALEPKD